MQQDYGGSLEELTADGRLLSEVERLAEFKTEKPRAQVPLQQVQIKRYGDAFVRRFRTPDIWVTDIWVKDSKGWRVEAVQVTPAKK